jgi:hypothetical protein
VMVSLVFLASGPLSCVPGRIVSFALGYVGRRLVGMLVTVEERVIAADVVV